jgi:hypothetical protein
MLLNVCTWSDKKQETNSVAWESRVGGERKMVMEHVPTCHHETRLNSNSLLSKSGRVFKYIRFLTLGRKVLECKSEQRVNIKFLVKVKKSVTETF